MKKLTLCPVILAGVLVPEGQLIDVDPEVAERMVAKGYLGDAESGRKNGKAAAEKAAAEKAGSGN